MTHGEERFATVNWCPRCPGRESINDSTTDLPASILLTPSEVFRSLEGSSKGDNHSEYRFAVAGLSLRLHSPEPHVAGLLYRAFSHLPSALSPRNDADIDIAIVTGVPRPRLAAESGTGFYSDHGRHRFHASPDGRFVCHEVLESGSLWCVDRKLGRVIGWIESADRITLNERDKPLPTFLSLLLEPFGLYMFHAALVSWHDQGVLFVGASGSGKSTSALSCLQGGFDFVAEDLVVLEDTHAGFVGHSVYSSAWIDPEHLSRLGDLKRYAHQGDGEQLKSVLMLADLMPDKMRSSAPLNFTMLPRVRPDAPSAIREIGKPEAFRQLGPNCLMTASRIDKKGFESLVRLVKATRCYQVDLGRDLDRVPSLVIEAVERDA